MNEPVKKNGSAPSPLPAEMPSLQDDVQVVIVEYTVSTGVIRVKGPVANKVLVYGMLESAKQAIAMQHLSISSNPL